MNLVVNGKPHEHLGHGALSELFEEMHANPQAIAVMVNGDVIPRKQWAGVRLSDADEVELLVFIAGG